MSNMEIRMSKSIVQRILPRIAIGLLISACTSSAIKAQAPPSNDPPEYGPYSAILLPDGAGLRYRMAKPQETPSPVEFRRGETPYADSVLQASSPWTISAWYSPAEAIEERELIAGVGDITGEYPRYLCVEQGKVALWMGSQNELSAPQAGVQDTWHQIAATFDGEQMRLYSDGVAVAHGLLTTGATQGVLQIGPVPIEPVDGRHFGGRVANFTVQRRALNDAEIKQLFADRPRFDALNYEEGSKPWPLQTRAQAGYRAPQDPQTLPKSRAPYPTPVARNEKAAKDGDVLQASGSNEWTLAQGWTLQAAPKVKLSSAQLSDAGIDTHDWLHATVPGTVLQSMIEDGLYPDPDYGLNNLQIPELLNRQDYWYRNEFPSPSLNTNAGDHLELTFQGINYRAEVWLNGIRLGEMRGAFQRGIYDITKLVKPRNVLLVLVSPPPHPGIPQEQSVTAGPGENGGSMEIDGPSFLATEGWDWIPAIRDRNTGLWQPVTLKVTRSLKIGDARVVSTFPGHDYSRAALAIDVPVSNLTGAAIDATLDASAEGIAVKKTFTAPPGETTISLTAEEFPQLAIANPRLWWPNGYGKPELYHLKLQLVQGNSRTVSDDKSVRFGIREVSYELSLLDSTGHLRRVAYTPADARGDDPVVDVSHEGMREIASADAAALHTPEEERNPYNGGSHVSSIEPGMENSPALRPLTDKATSPYLVIRVNGVRIAARGGNWGMDDSRKRVSREHLEPYFRLHRDANVNIIRNWVGQNTEETFFELADEYGLMVWNDFWESTQNYNIEAEDPVLFLDNAADTIKRFRNHPSIIVWCGRNEGVPQPVLNMGLEHLTRTLDGTRFYSPSSNQVNLQNSGPYKYQDPTLYYTAINHGFSVETGTPSMPTLESFESSMPQADWWPIDDVWAYHDWHQSGNGAVQPFMQEIEKEFGAPTSLPDFERKAQMLNYVDHRAIFEGMNANLWAPNSGRMLWMTQPAWPSTMWQILSSDYDTQASFYGTKIACEPLHVQLNLATGAVDVVNTTPHARPGLKVRARVLSLENTPEFDQTQAIDLSADDVAHTLHLDLPALEGKGVVLVVLDLTGSDGSALSHNVYWLAQRSENLRVLDTLPTVTLTASATVHPTAEGNVVEVQLTNPSSVVSLATKLTLLDESTKQRILPAYYSDNYVTLLPGETRAVKIEVPDLKVQVKSSIALRGWNNSSAVIRVISGS
jgi:Exo-beta-D-glucosaminidase Ig-fold domain/Concanavalin A-like lectin/glucanases superfamily/Glycosyl hydrolases family 2/Glycosyl hydrolases family 2, TIM barrel domain